MNEMAHPIGKSWINRPMVLVLMAIVAAGTMFTWWTVWHADRYRRESTLYQARLVAQAIRPERIGALSGTTADLNRPIYRRLKEQLATTRTIIPECRFIYLLGRRSDGRVFFFADSEPIGSKDESPPGQIYEEISDADLEAFTDQVALTSGPTTDRWGTWISAMVPLMHPDGKHLTAVLGMDFAARDWQSKLIRAALPPILFTLVTVLVHVIGTILLRRFLSRIAPSPVHLGYPEMIMAIAVLGIFISVSAACVVKINREHARLLTFRQLAQNKTAGIANVFHTLQNIEMEALARFFEASKYITPTEFKDYIDYLLKNPGIQYWAWSRWTPAADREVVEAQLQSEGLPGGVIWQPDSNGQRIPAIGRDVYFPVVHIASRTKQQDLRGYDIGADSFRQAALEAAMQNGLATCIVPTKSDPNADAPRTIEIFRPTFHKDGTRRPQGIGMAVLVADRLLRCKPSNDVVQLALAVGRHSGSAIETLAVSSDNYSRSDSTIAFVYPLFVFGKAFLVTAHADKTFIGLFPVLAPWLVLFTGMVLTALLMVLIGVTHRKREKLEFLVAKRTRDLIDARHRMELAINGADLGTWEWRGTNKKMIVNGNWAKILGYRLEEIEPLLDEWEQLTVPEDRPLVSRAMRQHLKGQSAFYEVEHRLRHKAGHDVWVLAKGRVIERDADGRPLRICGTCLDITEHKRSQKEREKLRELLLQSQKIEAIGQLAGGIAHDLNNLLSPIIGYGEILQTQLGDRDPRHKAVDAILSAGLRARDLVRQLLAFSRKQTLVFKPVNINQTIEGFQKLLRRTIREDITIEIILAPRIQPVMADAGQIEQIIMNLAVNAADAMPDGGRLTIETAMVELDAAYAAAHPSVSPGPHLMLAVSDTGCGMDESIRQRIFEPFFSTKGERGTGMGLATIFGIVKQHNGSIWVYSEMGRGTTFKIYLPITDTTAVEGRSRPQSHGNLTGNETILLVEDNQAVRELAQEVLDHQGYTILPAKNGKSALELIAAHDGPVHLLLTDVVMPGMNGKELYREAVAHHPKLKVLYMSGYTDNVIAHRGVLDDNVAFIQKPFTVEAIATKVREVLNKP